MKPVIIKNIEIGKGLPKIAVPLVAANTQELEQALRVLKETAFDIIEFRADFFQAALDAYFIAEQLGIARQAFPDKPLLLRLEGRKRAVIRLVRMTIILNYWKKSSVPNKPILSTSSFLPGKAA